MTSASNSHEEGFRSLIIERSIIEPGSVNNRMCPEFVSCSDDGMSVTVRYKLTPEMRNPMGWLHGGITSAMMDMGMGLLAFYGTNAVCPTNSMTINFLRPGKIGGYLVVRSRITHLGRRIVHLSSESFMQDEPEHLVATATGSYAVITSGDERSISDKIKSLNKTK